jgi:hypothetical protein
MILTAVHRRSRRKTCPSDTLCTSNTTRFYHHSFSWQRKCTVPEDSVPSSHLDTNKQPYSGPTAVHSTASQAIYLITPFWQYPRFQSGPLSSDSPTTATRSSHPSHSPTIHTQFPPLPHSHNPHAFPTPPTVPQSTRTPYSPI